MFGKLVRKRKLKKVIYKEFLESVDKKDFKRTDTLSKRYIKIS
jgi:hypothetical protein